MSNALTSLQTAPHLVRTPRLLHSCNPHSAPLLALRGFSASSAVAGTESCLCDGFNRRSTDKENCLQVLKKLRCVSEIERKKNSFSSKLRIQNAFFTLSCEALLFYFSNNPECEKEDVVYKAVCMAMQMARALVTSCNCSMGLLRFVCFALANEEPWNNRNCTYQMVSRHQTIIISLLPLRIFAQSDKAAMM